MTRVYATEHTPEPSGTARQKTSNTDTETVADGTERGWPQRIHISILKELGWGGRGVWT